MTARRRAAWRTDDNLEVINHRLDVFERQTRPLLDYYARREFLITIDGSKPVDEVTTAAITALDRLRPTLSDGPRA